MIKIQRNLVFICDSPECDSEEHWTSYTDIGATPDELFGDWIRIRYSNWRLVRKSGKIYCSSYCEEIGEKQ